MIYTYLRANDERMRTRRYSLVYGRRCTERGVVAIRMVRKHEERADRGIPTGRIAISAPPPSGRQNSEATDSDMATLRLVRATVDPRQCYSSDCADLSLCYRRIRIPPTSA